MSDAASHFIPVDPGWMILGAAVLVALLIFLVMVRSQAIERLVTIFLLGLVCLLIFGFGGALLRARDAARPQAATAAPPSFQERAAVLRLAASGSLACLDAEEPLVNVCEVSLFERPEYVTAARTLTQARLALLEDTASALALAPDPALEARVSAWRAPLVRDPYGIVAATLLERPGCTKFECPFLALLDNSGRIASNMSEGRLDQLIAKYAPLWERTARVRGAPRTGPFGLSIVEPEGSANQARPPLVNLPVDQEADAPSPPPVSRPPRPPARPAPRAQQPAQQE